MNLSTYFLKKNVNERYIEILSKICLLDIIFLPYIRFIYLPYSIILIGIYYLLNKGIYFPPKFKNIFFALCILSLLSCLLGGLKTQSFFLDNLEFAFIFMSSFFYYFIFYRLSLKFDISNFIKKCILLYCLIISSLQIFYVYKPFLFQDFMSKIYNYYYTGLFDFRFAFHFHDPNSFAYFTLVLIIPFLRLFKNFFLKIYLVIFSLQCAFFSQSRGALITLIICLFYISFNYLIKNYYKYQKNKNIIFIRIFLSIILLISLSFSIHFLQVNNPEFKSVFDLIKDRITNIDAYSTGGNRFDIWKKYITNFMTLPLGGGHNLSLYKSYFPTFISPHNDFLRILYSYGYIFTFIFFVWFFKNNLKIPLLFIPTFMAIMTNTFFDDYKLLALYFVILGLYLGSKDRYNQNFKSL